MGDIPAQIGSKSADTGAKLVQYNVLVTLRWVTETTETVSVPAGSDKEALAAARAWAKKQVVEDWAFDGDYEEDHHFAVWEGVARNPTVINTKGQTLYEIDMPLPPEDAIHEICGKRWAAFGIGGGCHVVFLVDAFPDGFQIKAADWNKNQDGARRYLPAYLDAEPKPMPAHVYVDRKYMPALQGAALSMQIGAVAARRNGELVAIVMPLLDHCGDRPNAVDVGKESDRG